MLINVDELNVLRRMGFEVENDSYASYISSVTDVVKDKMLSDMFNRYSMGLLTEEDVVRSVDMCNLDNLRCFTKIYEYEDSFSKERVLILLRDKYKMQEDAYHRNLVFQCIRRLCCFVDFNFLKDLCDDECLGLIVGEYARRNDADISFFDEIQNFIPCVFLGYTHLNNLVLDTFIPSFEKLIETNLGILEVLDYENREVEKVVVANLHRKGVLEYLIDHGLGSDDFLNRIVTKIERIDSRVFLKDNFFKRLTKESIFKCLNSFGPDELINVGLSGSGNLELYKILPRVLEGRMEEFADVKGILDVLILIVYYVPSIEFGASILCLPSSPEKDFLIYRERGDVKKRCCVCVDEDTGKIDAADDEDRYREEVFDGSSEFAFVSRRKVTEMDIQKYLDRISEPEPVDILMVARRRLGFLCFLGYPQKPTFEQLLELPSFYFVSALKFYTNSFLELLLQFDRILLPLDRKKPLIASRIVSIGYKNLFISYLVRRNKYFRIEIDFDSWSMIMGQEYKVSYLKDFPHVLVEKEEEIFEGFKDSMDALLPVIEVLRNREDLSQAPVIRFRKHAIKMLKTSEHSTAAFKALIKRSSPAFGAITGSFSCCDSDEKEIVDEYLRTKRKSMLDGIHGNDVEVISSEPAVLKRKLANFKVEIYPKKARTDELEEYKLSDLYKGKYSLESIDFMNFKRTVGQICNEVAGRISTREELERAAQVTSVLIKDDEGFHRMVSTLYRMNQFGKDFISFMEFFVFFMSYCRMEIKSSPIVVEILSRHFEEGGSSSILYFVFMKIRIEDLEALFLEFKDKGLKEISKSVCDRILISEKRMDCIPNCGSGEKILGDMSRLKVEIEQPVIRRKKGGSPYNIDVIEIWPNGSQRKEFVEIMTLFLQSEDESKNYFGIKGVMALGIFDMDVERFLSSRSDEVVEEALKMLQRGSITGSINMKLMEVLYKRGKLDTLGRMCLRTINIDILEREDVDRIYDMFFIDPINYLEILPRMLDMGYEVSTEVAMELIRQLRSTCSEDVINNIMMVLKIVKYTDEMAFESILSLETTSLSSKMFLIGKILNSAAKLSTQMFLKLCVCIGNEDNYCVVEGLLQILRNNGTSTGIVEKWKGNESLNKLMLRIYPFYMKDKLYYKGLLDKVRETDNEEWVFICRFHKDELEKISMDR